MYVSVNVEMGLNVIKSMILKTDHWPTAILKNECLLCVMFSCLNQSCSHYNCFQMLHET